MLLPVRCSRHQSPNHIRHPPHGVVNPDMVALPGCAASASSSVRLILSTALSTLGLCQPWLSFGTGREGSCRTTQTSLNSCTCCVSHSISPGMDICLTEYVKRSLPTAAAERVDSMRGWAHTAQQKVRTSCRALLGPECWTTKHSTSARASTGVFTA